MPSRSLVPPPPVGAAPHGAGRRAHTVEHSARTVEIVSSPMAMIGTTSLTTQSEA